MLFLLTRTVGTTLSLAVVDTYTADAALAQVCEATESTAARDEWTATPAGSVVDIDIEDLSSRPGPVEFAPDIIIE